MLVVTRKLDEAVIVGDHTTVVVLGHDRGRTRLGFVSSYPVWREELVTAHGATAREWHQKEKAMANIARAGVTQIIAVVDATTKAAIDAVDATQEALSDTAVQVVEIGGKAADLVIEEIREARERLVGLLNEYADAIPGGDIKPE